ncbi:Tim44 domain-containing protein, partial [Elioraea rosea]|uniref:Tim44 domain-containing protein n=1 Tax=Elioraea rosea TaxID=2492390 RepID=UPI0011852787
IAEARGGRGGSFGSRGSQTYTAPPPTRTAPAPARPVERSMTETAPARPGVAPNTAQAGAAGMASRSPFMTGLMGGLLGAGLIGLLFGGGFFGAGMAGFLGLLLQLALLGGLVWLALRLFRRTAPQPAAAGPAGTYARTGAPIPDVGSNRPMGGAAGGAPSAAPAAMASGLTPIPLDKADFDAFEQTLKDVQAAWSEADLRALSGLLTPEMLQYFSEMLAEDASRGVRNRVTDVVLEEGDLSEAWREAGRDYATVAMRFSAIDVDTRLSDGAVISGEVAERTVATELWTFVRAQGGRWLLSAIQQTG